MRDYPGHDDWFSFRIGETMNRINCYGFYTLGKWIRRVEALGPDSNNLDMAIAAMRAERLLLTLLYGSNVKLKATAEASGSLITGFKHLTALLEKDGGEANPRAS